MKRGKWGKQWEAIITSQNVIYERTDQAYVYKQHPEVLVTKQVGASFQGRWSGKGQPDYAGLFDGLFFGMEAKSTQSGKLTWAALRGHQAYQLDQIVRHHGVAFVAVLDAPNHMGLLIPWARIRQAWFADRVHWEGERVKPAASRTRAPNGSASMSVQDLRARAIWTHYAAPQVGWDYLPALRGYANSVEASADHRLTVDNPAPFYVPEQRRDR